jgi:predicted adenine nucleotide alpha hydrolase (AANH) superfamily ATPase
MLREDFEISFYWYNPNIYNKEEYYKRKDASQKYARAIDVKFYEEENFVYDYGSRLSKGGENCVFCYNIRLEKAAQAAKKNNFEFFTTSLLSSPYQKHDLIARIGEEKAKKSGVNFLYVDFRPAFYEGKNLLRKEGYYIQRYCGCAKSYNERFAVNEA